MPRKKCDETKPECVRCLASGNPCSYEYVEYSENGGRVKRTKPAPRSTLKLLANASQNVSSSPNGSDIASVFAPSESGPTLGETCSSSSLVTQGVGGCLSLPSVSSLLPQLLTSIGPTCSSPTSSNLVWPPSTVPPVHDMTPATRAPGSSSQVFASIDLNEDLNDDEDPERVGLVLYGAPTVDKNAKDNSLPFALYCYSQWVLVAALEPLKVMPMVRKQVIAHFSSEGTRTGTILLANVMDMFAKDFAIDGARKAILSRLALNAQQAGAAFIGALPSYVPALDRQNAIRTLDNMLEIFELQLRTQSTFECIKSVKYTAPVFRRACPGLLTQPINLPNILLDLSLTLRRFATTDIVMSMVTGLPTCFRYEVPFSPELCEKIYRWQLQGNYGLQWFYGFPDQFLMLIAWINTLAGIPGSDTDSDLVASIERQLPRIKIAMDRSGDPSLRIRRMAVLEAWRFTILIYLYMVDILVRHAALIVTDIAGIIQVLCKANAQDARVVHAQKGFMRLLRGVKPGRFPDVHLIISMVVAGVATVEERDQDMLRQRILGLRECAVKGTIGNDVVLRLVDLWARTRDEGRAALWSDWGMVTSRFMGE
ncbi:hypothetical protein FRC11_006361 [Ceratobasidium sp. 423]|nr:hypothetical protein FRC11_006361 [Ceratobasidium sp. 423]